MVEVDEEHPADPAAALSRPLYFLLVASRDAQALQAVAPALSVLADRGDWIYRDYEKVYREMVAATRRAEALQRELARRDGWRGRLRLALARLGVLK